MSENVYEVLLFNLEKAFTLLLIFDIDDKKKREMSTVGQNSFEVLNWFFATVLRESFFLASTVDNVQYSVSPYEVMNPKVRKLPI